MQVRILFYFFCALDKFLTFQMLWQIPAFTLCAFNIVKYLWQFLQCEVFLASLPLRHLFLFHLNYLLIYVKRFTLTNLLQHMFRVSWMVPLSTFLHSDVCTLTLFTFDLNFTSTNNTFLFSPSPFLSFSSFSSCLPTLFHSAHSCLLMNFLSLSIIYFCKMLHGFTTRRQKGNSVPYLAVCVWTC